VALGLLAWGSGLSAWAASEPDLQRSGVPLVGSRAVVETTGEIMARQRAVAQPQAEPRIFFLGRADASGKKVDPAGEGLIQGPAAGSRLPQVAGGGGPLAPQVIGVNADGPVSTNSPCGTPPDTMGAVGPTQFIVAENCNIVTYSKATGAADGVLNTTPDTFFASVRSSSVSDPHIRYDRLTGRWFIVIIDVTFPNNRVLIAVSNTATITNATVWTFFFFQSAVGTHTSCLADYPTPGIDASALYIGVNQFCGGSLGTASYAGSDGYVVQKSSVLGGGPIRVTGFQSMTDAYTPQGVDNPDPAAAEGYFLGGSVGFFNKVNLFRVSNPATLSPTVSAVAITTATQGQQITQPHLGNTGGTNGRLDASDNRPFAAAFRDGSLWTTMGVGTTVSGSVCQGAGAGTATRDAVFWWELRGIPTGSTPSIRQAGIVCDTATTNPAFYSYGTVMVNGQGHAALGYSIAGASTFVSVGTSGRLVGDPLGSLQAINTYGAGAAAYNPSWDSGAGSGFRRWGDYSFTSLDPCDDMTIWTAQEYVPVANNYGTRFAQLKAPPPATPASASPATVAAGQASVDVVVTGTSTGGSGFYDTPASLASEACRLRIAGAVAGVTVNSITYTDPTHVTLNLSTVGATAGTKTVTVTNPDGQSASAAILTVGSSPPPAPTASNNGPLCAGQTLQLTASTVAGATYAWTGPNGFTSALQNPSIANATTAATGIYSVTATVGGLTSAPGTTTATVNAVPGTPVVTAASPVAAGSTGNTASVPQHAGSTYAWTIGNGTITAGQGTSQITYTAGAAGTPLTLSVTESNSSGCTSGAGTATVTVAPPAPAASNNGPLCAGQTLQLTASTVAGATYAWTGPNGFTSALQNPSIANATTAATGTYSVTATVGGVTSVPGTTSATVNAVPGTPVITVAPIVGAGSPNRTATVAAHAGSSYAWTIGNGTITAGQGTNQITFTAGVAGTPLTLSVTETSSSGCTSGAGTATVTVAPAGSFIQYYTVSPCRQLDTRISSSPLPPGGTLTVPLTGGSCSIPATARAVSVNVTVTETTAPGYLTLYPATGSLPLVSNINFVAGVTRANNAVLVLADDGSGEVDVFNGSGGTAQVIIDVNGYFE
jgi:hypothetical protein